MVRSLTRLCRRRARALTRFALSPFVRAREGATAVEFALIAPAFIALLVAIFQGCVYLYVQAVLQNAATETGRLFLTGQVQSNGWNQQTVSNKACAFMGSMFDCTQLYLNVQTYQDFTSSSTSAPALYDSNNNPIPPVYNTGTQGQIMVLQLVYQWKVASGPLGFSLVNLPNSATEMVGMTAFRVEPY
ncbi:MAG: pilus assembly protein [Alphaproteobacteria bacterium]|nr:pilus assembly protein [Alphaproteobacteria bacterium]